MKGRTGRGGDKPGKDCEDYKPILYLCPPN